MKQELSHPISKVLAGLVAAICSHPVEVREVCFNGNLDLSVWPHAADFPILVGTAGRQIIALKTLAAAMANRVGIKCTVHLEETTRGIARRHERNPEPQVNPLFNLDALEDALIPVARLAFGPSVKIDTEVRGNDFYAYVGVPSDDTLIVNAIGDLLYCVGRKNGRTVEVKTALVRKCLEAV